ncbi:MAG TPA: hypothetical protein VIG54_11110 [Lysobacter sp.]
MTIRIKAGLLAACAFATSLFAPTAAFAAKVGYYGTCYGENPAVAITTAGHTPVAVSSLTSASLSGLAALFVNSCNWPTSTALNTAISGGLVVIAHDPGFGGNSAPGHSLTRGGAFGTDIDFVVGLPFLSGPGGAINNTSLDGGSSSNHGYFSGALPSGGQVLATTANASQIVTFTYPYGAGRIVYSTIPLGCYLSGGDCISLGVAADMQRYAANIIAAYAEPEFTTCTAEGYKGAQLTMCQKVCESNLTGSALSGMIKLYVAAYREQPACAR